MSTRAGHTALRRMLAAPNLLACVLCAGFWALGCGAPPPCRTPQTATRQTTKASLKLNPPSLLSSIYEKACTQDHDCRLVPTGDVCRCQSFASVAQIDESRFMEHRGRLGARCENRRPAVCHADPLIYVARCHKGLCLARAPEDLQCVSKVEKVTEAAHVFFLKPMDKPRWPHETSCLGTLPEDSLYQGVGLLVSAAGKYRFEVSPQRGSCQRPLGLMLVTPDCNGGDVACRSCQDTNTACVVDLHLDADARVVVLAADAEKTPVLSVRRWDPTRPFRPPAPMPQE